MEFNLIFKIDSRTENLIKFLDLIYASERKVWIEDEFARWLSTDGIYSTHIERTIKDLAYPFDFSDKIVCGGQERYFYDAFHGLPRSGQPYCFTNAEWENIMSFHSNIIVFVLQRRAVFYTWGLAPPFGLAAPCV